MAGGTFDESILTTAVDRRAALSLLSKAPRHRRELQDELDVSKTTCHRIVRTFDEHGLIGRTDRGYELTEKGRLLEERVSEYYDGVRTIFSLDPLVAAFAEADVDLDVEPFVGARITRPKPDDPTIALDREFEIFRDANHFTVIDANQHVPELFLKQVFELGIERGMEAEHIAPKSVIEKRLSAFPEVHKSHREEEATLKYRVCSDPPFGLTLYDNEHVVVRAYDDETGAIELMVDTDDREAVAWAEGVIDHYRERAEPPSAFDELPEWTPDGTIGF